MCLKKEPDGAEVSGAAWATMVAPHRFGAFGGEARKPSRQGSSAYSRRASPRPARSALLLVGLRVPVSRLAVGDPVARLDDGRVLAEVVHDVDPGEDVASADEVNLNLLSPVEARISLKPVHRLEAVVVDGQHLALDVRASSLYEGGIAPPRVVDGACGPRLLTAGVARTVRVAFARDERSVDEDLVFRVAAGKAESLFAPPPHGRREVPDFKFDWR